MNPRTATHIKRLRDRVEDGERAASSLHEVLCEQIEQRVHAGQDTYAAIARRAGIAPPHIHRVLAGGHRIGKDYAERLTRALSG